MEKFILKIDELKKEFDKLKPLSPDNQQRLDKKIRLEFNYNSNHIEGNTLTYGETELLLIFGDTKGNHSLREYEEMKGHDVAISLIQEWAADKEHPLTEAYIKNLNQIILKEPFWKDAITPNGQKTRRLIKVGDYKEYPNSVQLSTGEIFHYASPKETPILMGELIQWLRNEEEKGELHPVALAALLHYKFVRIHPFDDGNGRICRLLMNFILLKNGFPFIIIKSADKQNYLRALNQADSGDLNAFIKYIAEQLIWSFDLSISAAKGESIEEPDDLDKEITVWKKQLKKEAVQPIPKSDDQVVELYIKCISRLLDMFHEKMHKAFYDLFIEWIERGWVNNGTSNNQGKLIIENKMRRLSELLADPSKKSIYGDEDNINSIALDIDLRGFKGDGTNTFNISSRLEIVFDQFKYMVNINRKLKMEKLYSELIDRNEQTVLINDLVKETFQQVKQMIKNQ